MTEQELEIRELRKQLKENQRTRMCLQHRCQFLEGQIVKQRTLFSQLVNETPYDSPLRKTALAGLMVPSY